MPTSGYYFSSILCIVIELKLLGIHSTGRSALEGYRFSIMALLSG